MMNPSTAATTSLFAITGCARCGNNHAQLTFHKFARQNVRDANGSEWDYWASCPTNGEPLLLKVFTGIVAQPAPVETAPVETEIPSSALPPAELNLSDIPPEWRLAP